MRSCKLVTRSSVQVQRNSSSASTKESPHNNFYFSSNLRYAFGWMAADEKLASGVELHDHQSLKSKDYFAEAPKPDFWANRRQRC